MKAILWMTLIFSAAAAVAQDDAFNPDQAAIAKTMAACGSDKVNFDVNNSTSSPPAVAEAGKALVYMIEDAGTSCGGWVNCGATTKVGMDGAWVGANRGNSYFTFAISAGEHHLCVKWQSRFSRANHLAALSAFTAEAGKTYYFRARVIASQETGAYLDLDPINADQGRFFVASYPLSAFHAKR